MSASEMISRLFDRIFVIIGAFAGSQIPTFIQQYSQQLVGHIDELQYQVKAWQQLATLSGKPLDEYIQKFSSHADLDFSRQGQLMEAMIHRLNDLSLSMKLLQESSFWSRPFVFVSHVNGDIFQSTLHTFVPQMTLTLEGIFYTFVGLVFGYAVYRLLARVVSRILTFFAVSIRQH